jgi:DNA-binding transcriptional LysR family regulator
MRTSVVSLGRRIDLNLVSAFEAIYRTRNLTEAGRLLGLSQPAMSHALSRLRTALKDPLFVRLTRGLQPTALADEIAPALIDGLATIKGSLERKQFDPATSERVFQVAMGDIAEVVHLPPLIATLAELAPKTRLRTFGIPGAQLQDALAAGVVDFGTGNYKLGAGCREAPLYDAEYACVVRADHPSIRSKLTLSQFRSAGHILVNPKTAAPHGQDIERALTSRAVRARIAVEISHFHGVAALIPESDLIATIPVRLAQAMKRHSNIAIFAPPIPLPKIRVSLYWHERFHRDPANVWLRGVYLRALRPSS